MLAAGILMISLLTGCSNAQVRRTPVTDLGEPWFCEMNEARDDWDCVRDEELARNPRPQRLPGDPVDVDPDPFESEASDLPSEAVSTAGLANPSGAIDFEAIEDAVVRTDRVNSIMQLPPDQFVVQLAATETRAQADGFISNYDLGGMEDVFTLELGRENDLYYVVVFGVYENLDAAQAAVDGRPERLEDVRPWIRPLETMQSGILAAEAIHGAPHADG